MLNKQNFKNWLDDEYELSEKMIQKKKWNMVTVADTLNPMEAEWLAETLSKRGVSNIIGVSFEYKGEPTITNISINRDSIIRFNLENSSKYILLTSPDEEFLYYKDQNNRFFNLCGNIDFLKEAYKCSFETIKLMYFDYWVDDDFNSPKEKTFLTNLWEKYSTYYTSS